MVLRMLRQNQSENPRVAYSPAEWAAANGRHPTWAYRQIYAGKVNVIDQFGRLLIPASEVSRVLGQAKPYDPKPTTRKPKAAKRKGSSK
jgi:hypothetical protein